MSLKIVRSSNNAVLDNIFYQKTIANGCNYIYIGIIPFLWGQSYTLLIVITNSSLLFLYKR